MSNHHGSVNLNNPCYRDSSEGLFFSEPVGYNTKAAKAYSKTSVQTVCAL